ncbi:TonB-dependent receptor [Croceibacterium sp. LX-88]|uniref:TonB-dependent receptor n=1 Tax=Croceibacterium selenioxidans TaxID=2838833 RepID=A0ABS5W4D7_9SPHN|nr:TonB-dependent receptor [Croceibacterium selenioxidans]MBT2134620.1 TonB-dependent receptor [Croceibacterium selenioxidans]
MFRKMVGGALVLSALMLPLSATAQGYAFPIDIRPQPLTSALRDLARQTGSELLYDQAVLRGKRSPRIRSNLTVEASLRQILAGTDLTTRRASSGAWVIERRRPAESPSKIPAFIPPPVDLPAPEILVTARRSQNVDIQRRENDIQPYQVTTGEEIVRSHRDNLDQYFRSRITGNTQALPPNLFDRGATNSQIDLRGMGTAGTMVLIDGRRMPGVPDINLGTAQPDINAIPLHAVERIETLTGTAGGIHGFGALGGVVNVVLKRDYRGAELHATGGISARGDAERLGLEGRFGFTPDDGRTDVMLGFGWSSEEPLLIGQRDYTVKNRRRNFQLSPDSMFLLPANANGALAIGPLGFGPLVLKPEYGGGELSGGYAFLPVGFGGNPSDLFAALSPNGGLPDFGITEAEAQSQMGSNANTLSGIASLRHDFGGGVEGYFDALYLRNRGTNFFHTSFGSLTMSPDAPQNPFTDFVTVYFPASPEDGYARTTFEGARLTAGAIVPLPLGWSGTAEATFGYSQYDRAGGTEHSYDGPLFLFGFPGDDPELTPFGNWDDFLQATQKYQTDGSSADRGRNRYQEQSLRLAGPLFDLGSGATTLTVLAQRRRERVPRYVRSLTDKLPERSGTQALARSVAEESLYGELRAPIFGSGAPVPLLDNLELQLALRHDRQKFVFASDAYEPETSTFADRRFSGTSVTAGAKVSPLPWLMLRASYATGAQPPSPNLLVPLEIEADRMFLLDPKRGNAFFTDEGTYIEGMSGNPDLEEIEASTLSLGAVLNPFGDNAPRFSLDYSRINRTGDPFMPASVLDHEDDWPERVIREPLTDEDRALGYTGGKILLLDSSVTNAGRVKVETVDGVLEWSVPFLGGTLHPYAVATWQISNELVEPFADPVERVGYLGEPLGWRANGGFDFTSGPLSLGANLQYFSRYRVSASNLGVDERAVELQGSQWVGSQAYLDIYVGRRFRTQTFDASLDFGIINALDQAPPREATLASGPAFYSMYGDPRGRRFQLVLSAEF